MTTAPPPPGMPTPAARIVLPTTPRQPIRIGAKVILYTAPGWGKTTIATTAPKPLLVMCPQDSGYDQLNQAGLVTPVPAIVAKTWPELLAICKAAAAAKEYETVWFDLLGGFERLCAEYVRDTEFEGSEAKFAAYGSGMKSVIALFDQLTAALDLIALSGKHVFVLAHAATRNHKNPLGDNFDQYTMHCNEKIADALRGWASDVIFGAFETVVVGGKGIGGKQRVAHGGHSDARVAKSQRGAPDRWLVPNTTDGMYAAVFGFLNNKKG